MNSARLERALSVLGYLASHPDGRSLSEMASDLDLPVSSTHDLLQALVEIGALRVSSPRTYVLGPRTVTLGLAVADSIDLREAARSPLSVLADELGETISLAIRVEHGVVYADRYKLATPSTSVFIALGESRPLHSSSAGKLITAHNATLQKCVLDSPQLEAFTSRTLVDPEDLRCEFARIRQQHFSLNDGEYVEGIRGLATPIVDAAGEVIAAAQLVVPTARLADARVRPVAARMSEAASWVSEQLGAIAANIPRITL